MQYNNKMMSMTMKPIIFFLLVFVFASSILLSPAYAPFVTLEDGTGVLELTNGDSFDIQDTEGSLSIESNGDCNLPCKTLIGDDQWVIKYGNSFIFFEDTNRLTFSRVIANLPIPIPFIGDTLGWLGVYILISLPSSMVFKKLLKIN